MAAFRCQQADNNRGSARRFERARFYYLAPNRRQFQERKRCVELMHEIAKTLRAWHHPIDILLLLFG